MGRLFSYFQGPKIDSEGQLRAASEVQRVNERMRR